MAGNPGTDALFGDPNNVDDDKLSDAVQLLLTIEQLKRRGLGADEIAQVLESSSHEVPGGGEWDAAAVARIGSIVASVRDGGAAPPSSMPLPTSAGVAPPGTTANVAAGQAPAATVGVTVPGASAFQAGGWTEPDESSSASMVAIGVMGVASVALLGVIALAVWIGDGGSGSVAEGTDDAIGSATTPVTDTSALGAPPEPPEDVDPADMMSIRVEPEAPAGSDVAVDGSVEAATATVKADGLLHLEGAFPSQDEADRYIDGVAKVFGRESIVEAYSINPAAPLPKVSDVALDKPVLFESGTAVIDPSYISFLEACGDVLRLNPHITMSIAAFTDSTGSEELNLELSQQRAQAIYDFYRELDIDDTQLLSFGYGESNPVADNETEAGRQQNRRAMLQLLDVMADETGDS